VSSYYYALFLLRYEDTHVVLILYLHMCPHTTMLYGLAEQVLDVSSYYCMCVLNYAICFLIFLYALAEQVLYISPNTTVCVLILLHMCPHTAIYVRMVPPHVSSYYCMYILIYCPQLLYLCPHTTLHVSACYDVCVRILLFF
jgi:hypothetical protein